MCREGRWGEGPHREQGRGSSQQQNKMGNSRGHGYESEEGDREMDIG